jgi:plasmid stabilization system protein ParE
VTSSQTKAQAPLIAPSPLSLVPLNRSISSPERGRPASVSNARELIVPFGRSSYVVRYAYRGERDEVVIFRIWHSRERRE